MLKSETNFFVGIIFFCMLLVGGCSSDGEEPEKIIVVNDLDSLQKKIEQLAGNKATDCGDIRLIDIDDVYPNAKAQADCCVAMSLAEGKSFYVMYQEIDPDSIRGRGYLSNELGELSVHTWDSVMPSVAPGRVLNHYWPFECDLLVLEDDVCSVPTNELPFCDRPK